MKLGHEHIELACIKGKQDAFAISACNEDFLEPLSWAEMQRHFRDYLITYEAAFMKEIKDYWAVQKGEQ